MQETLVTIKQVRMLLKHWGRFWKCREFGKGYNRQAVTEQQGGRGYAGHADAMQVPTDIATLTSLIASLSPECIRALRAKYLTDLPFVEALRVNGFDSKKSADFWLVKAERSLMVQLG